MLCHDWEAELDRRIEDETGIMNEKVLVMYEDHIGWNYTV